MGSNSQSFANTGALVTGVKNFPESRGAILGLLKGFVGLSGAIITQLYHAFYGHDTKSLILLISLLPPIISITFLKTIRIIKVVHQANEMKMFYKFLYISLALAGFLMVVIILQNKVSFSKVEFSVCAFVVTTLLFAPIVVVVRQELNLIKTTKQQLNDTLDSKVVSGIPSPEKHDSNSKVVTEDSPEIPSPGSQGLNPLTNPKIVTKHSPEIPLPKTKISSFMRNVLARPDRGEDYTIFQALFNMDMLALFVAATFGAGGTLTAIDNLGQIGNSLGYPKESITTFISLVSIWNYLGRVFSGFVSEILLKKYKFPRPLMLTFVLLLACGGHLLIAFGVPNSLYISSMIVGFCFGAQWPLIFAIVSELFGLKYYATISNFGAGASPVGTYVLNVRVAGHFYDKVALKQMAAKGLTRVAGKELTCTGVECFKIAFLIITGATLFGCFFSFILVLRTIKFYRGDIYKNFREEAEVAGDELAFAPPSSPPPVRQH